MSVLSLHRRAPTSALPPATTRTTPTLELVLSGDLGRQHAGELERYLSGGIERGCDIVVDLADVRMIDVTCLDVLVRAARAADAVHRTLQVVTPSPLVRMTMRRTGTDTTLAISDDRATALRRCRAWPS